MNKLIVAFVLLAVAVGASQAIKCYVCSGMNAGDACGDPFKTDDGLLQDCSSTGCLKTKVNDLVTRACGSGGSTSCSTKALLSVTATTCGCNTDKCNSAGYVKASIVALVVSVSIPLFVH